MVLHFNHNGIASIACVGRLVAEAVVEDPGGAVAAAGVAAQDLGLVLVAILVAGGAAYAAVAAAAVRPRTGPHALLPPTIPLGLPLALLLMTRGRPAVAQLRRGHIQGWSIHLTTLRLPTRLEWDGLPSLVTASPSMLRRSMGL